MTFGRKEDNYMIEKLELLYQEIQEEAMMTSQAITKLVEKEMQIYYWNIGRILMTTVDNQKEFMELSHELLKYDRTMTIKQLLSFVNLYQTCPNVEDLFNIV